jgi:hypothetical protein
VLKRGFENLGCCLKTATKLGLNERVGLIWLIDIVHLSLTIAGECFGKNLGGNLDLL